MRFMQIRVSLPCFLLAISGPAYAVDGVLEISQTCAVNAGCFAGDAAGFPVTITTAGSYRLTSNLVLPDENTTGIMINTGNVSFDLNGFAIIRAACVGADANCTPTTGSGSGVLGLGFGISVKNGSIVGSGGYGINVGEHSEVTGLRIRWNYASGIVAQHGSLIRGNTVYENNNVGIDSTGGSVVSGNSVYKNGSYGILGNDGTISGNDVTSNGDDGIAAGNCLVERNTSRQNAGYGLSLGNSSAYRGNFIKNNTLGTVRDPGVNMGGNVCNLAICP